MSAGSAAVLCCLLALLAGSLGRPQWQVRSTYSGTPGFYRGGSGVILGERSGFNRFGGNTRLTSLNAFSGGSTSGSNSYSGGNAFGSQFFSTQLRRISNSFSSSLASSSRPSSSSSSSSSDSDSDSD